MMKDAERKAGLQRIYRGAIQGHYSAYMERPVPFYKKQIKELYAAYVSAGGSEKLDQIIMERVREVAEAERGAR